MSNSCRLRVVHLLLIVLTILITRVEGDLSKWSFANFSSSLATVRDSIVLLDDAAIVNTTGPPRLVFNARGSQTGVATAGRVVYASPVQFKNELTRTFAAFSTNFTFSISDPGLPKPFGCGGFTFNIMGNNSTVGESGDYLGLTNQASNGLPTNRFIAVEFDTSISIDPLVGDPSFAHIGLDVNGVKSDYTYNLCSTLPGCTDLVNRGDYLAKIAYSSAKQSLSVELYLNTTNLVANWTASKLSLEPIFQEYMYVGFTGSNGALCNQTHTIYSWYFSTSRSSSSPQSAEAPPSHVYYSCYKVGGCDNHLALKVGVSMAAGIALIFLMIFVFCVFYRKKQKNPEYKAVDVSGPNSGPQTGGVNAVKVNAKAASTHNLPAPQVNIALSSHQAKAKDPNDLKSGDFAPVADKPSVAASSISDEPKPVVPVVESVNQNPHGKVTMCCVQTKPKRNYEDTVVFTVKELAHATKNFSEKLMIGGTRDRKPVFKGVLRDTGAEVAIKEIKLNNISNEFVSKAMLLGRIRHPNLVHLLGWCKCEEKGKLYLVYEYMERGSIDKFLHVSKDTIGFLGFDARYNVLVGVAAGLNYLHAEWEQCVLHRDIKPSNVYLDAMFNAHVGNFSHASLVDHDKVAHSTVMDGTLGYMAPEIPFTGKPTTKSDTFSYGILMLEVVCGRLPLDWHLPQEERVLLDWVWRAHREGDIMRVADKNLEKSYSEEQMATLLQVGLNCAHPDPSMRPNMAFVWKILIGGAKPPELPAEKPVFENYAALNSLGVIRNSASRGNLGSTSSDT